MLFCPQIIGFRNSMFVLIEEQRLGFLVVLLDWKKMKWYLPF